MSVSVRSIMMRTTASAFAAALVAVSLAGCSNTVGADDIFSALGAGVDPYASSVTEQAASSSSNATSSARAASSTPAPAAATSTAAAPAPAAASAAAETVASAAPSAAAESAQQETNHYDGESVTITGTGNGTSIYATWTRDGDGDWAAVFLTNNYTTLYAYQSGSTWTFYTAAGRQVTHTSVSSAQSAGAYGPMGEESFWQDVADPSIWY
ncbi:MAG: hypothetical protein SOI26_00180 [Coriobacteriales bacterium]